MSSASERSARPLGRVKPAPDNHLSAGAVQAALGRRRFLATAAVGGIAIAAAGQAVAQARGAPPEAQPWTKSLGTPVGAHGYGVPSKYESAVQRRQSPGLTPQPQSSVSFTPLQGLFGIITPSGVHFERHHQGWWDVDPVQHRLMVHGLVKRPLVSRWTTSCGCRRCRASTSSSAAPTAGWSGATSRCRRCSTRTACRVQRIHRRAAVDAARRVGFDSKSAQFVLAEGRGRFGADPHDPDGARARRRDGRVWAERRDAAPRERLSAAPVVPGVQGVSWVKWLRRLEVGDKPWNARRTRRCTTST